MSRSRRDKNQTRKNKRKLILLASVLAIIVLSALVALSYTNSQDSGSIGEIGYQYILSLRDESGLVSREYENLNYGVISNPQEIADEKITKFERLTEIWLNSLQILNFDYTVEGTTFRPGGVTIAGISLSFTHPSRQIFVLLDRVPNPRLDTMEYTVFLPEDGTTISVLNFGARNVRGLDSTEFSESWAIIQALCLGSTGVQNEGSDAGCNIISANAAAGFIGLTEAETAELISRLGTVQLEGSDQTTTSPYVFIPAFWELFAEG